jgi:hypothetical protein
MIRVRHYTRVSAMRKIMREGVIRARDQHKVFIEKAASRKLSPSDAEDRYGIRKGRANAYVEFDIEEESICRQYNKEHQIDEYYVVGDVDLVDRNPKTFANF